MNERQYQEVIMSEQQIQKVRVKRLAHVGFWATDVATQTRFYRQVLGFNLRATEIKSAGQDVEFEDANTYLSLGDEHHCLGLFNDTRPATSNGRGPAQHTRLHHIAFEVDTDAELAALAARLNQSRVEFYIEALGFDISDWLLRECVWLRCNSDHHTLILMRGKSDIDHIGYSIPAGPELLAWADYLSRQQTAILWGPGRHGAGNDLFLRFADVEGVHIELSAELQQYYDHDVTTPPRLWHSRPIALNLWGVMPTWIREEVRV